MKHRNSHLLVGYWSRLRQGRAVPDQTDIDPRAIKRMLSYVFILDASDIARPVYRLAGTSLCECFGTELKAINFLSHWESQSRVALSSLLARSLKTCQPLCLSSVAATAERGMVECETVLAPLSFGSEKPIRFIGMMQMLNDMSTLAGRPIAFERLVGSRLVNEDEPALESPARDDNRSQDAMPYLRLVVNRDRKPNTVHVESANELLDVFGTGISAR